MRTMGALTRVLVCGAALCAGSAAAQGVPETVEAPARRGHAYTATALDPGHWAIDALRRADALGLLDNHLPAQRSVPLEVVERALRSAAIAAEERHPAVATLAAGWHARLREEFPGLVDAADDDRPAAVLLGASGAVGMDARRGAAAPGLGEFEPHRSGALPLADRTRMVVRGDAHGVLGRHLGGSFVQRLHLRGAELQRLEVTAGLGGWTASIGRLPIGYAHGVGGSVTLTGDAALDAIGVQTRTPFRLPWVLGYLGPISFATSFARFTEERHPGDPYFWSASGQFQPHPRVTLGVHRAALFGGSHPVEAPVTFGKIVDMLIGRVAGIGFEDQIVSVSGRFHLPTESVLPLTAYLEWGAEDAAGAWWAVPGRVIGLESAALPFAPGVRAGVEYTHFEPSCCNNPQWYRHWSFHGSWAAGDRTLGHPLGGDGREALAHASAHLMDARLRVNGRGFVRSRRSENLFSPGRTGRSLGAGTAVEWRPTARTEFRLTGEREDGDGWAETNLRMEGRVFVR